jgi:tetratricopeptide (TPR) repeat protein
MIIALLRSPATLSGIGSARQESIQEMFQKARTYETERNYPAAESIYQKVLALDPKNAEALKRLGILEQTELRFDESIQLFKRILSEQSDYPQVNFFLGLSYYGRHDLKNAFGSFNQELKTSAPHPATRYYLALVLEAEGRTNEAIDQLNEVAAQNPDKPEVLYELARLHVDASFRAIDRLRRIDPDSFQNHAFMAQLYGQEGHYEAAISEYQAALQKQPDTVGIHFPLGVAYRRLHQFEAAEKELLLALQESPDDPHTNLSLGDIALYQKQFNKALPYLKRAAAVQPKDADTHLFLGRCYVGLGELQQAEAELLLTVRLAPNDPRSHFTLAQIYQKLDRPTDRQRELDIFNRLSKTQESGASSTSEEEPPPSAPSSR